MNFMNKMERKLGRYAIGNLPAVIIALYVAGYIVELFQPQLITYLTLEPYYILHGQVWRLVSWIVVPPSSLNLFTIIMLLFYFQLGKILERTWGAFRFNLYIISGIIFTVIGSFILYFIAKSAYGYYPLFGVLFNTYYINMSIFLAFAASYPDMQVMLYFLIPIKIKWMGFLYAGFLIYEMIGANWVGRVAIIASLMNFIIFFLTTRDFRRVSPKEIHRKQQFKRTVKEAAPKAGPRHRCAICGRTEADDDRLEFRFCSKCDGDYEYCQDHLFTHTHKKIGM